MRSAIKIVKRDQRNQPKKEEPETKQTPEQSAREMVIVVKRWVTEWKERKATLMY
jgi:23S rRNA maturation-related 3'-5' exoribonuclease YhaM